MRPSSAKGTPPRCGPSRTPGTRSVSSWKPRRAPRAEGDGADDNGRTRHARSARRARARAPSPDMVRLPRGTSPHRPVERRARRTTRRRAARGRAATTAARPRPPRTRRRLRNAGIAARPSGTRDRAQHSRAPVLLRRGRGANVATAARTFRASARTQGTGATPWAWASTRTAQALHWLQLAARATVGLAVLARSRGVHFAEAARLYRLTPPPNPTSG